MRSRYAAYAMGRVQYIIDTTCPQSPAWGPKQHAWRQSIKAFCKQTRFAGLSIDHTQQQGDRAYVTFTAALVQAGRQQSMHERSVFWLRNNVWLYAGHDADAPSL